MADGYVQIEPEPLRVSLKRRGSVVVAVPQGCNPPELTAAEVTTTINEARERKDCEP